MKQLSDAHRRFNPLLGEWVLCSPQRLQRPWRGRVEVEKAAKLLKRDPACHLCPGSERVTGARNPDYIRPFAFDNDFPSLQPLDPPIRPANGATTAPVAATTNGAHTSGELFVTRPEKGICRVLSYSARHDVTMAKMDRWEISHVVDAWAREERELGERPEINHVQIFENKGEIMGCSNPHPHCQIWATETIPSIPAKKGERLTAYLETNGRDMLGAYLEGELERQERIVGETPDWVALVPFWAVWPFEVMVLPRHRVSDIASLDERERNDLAEILRMVTRRYDALFQCDFPYTMAWSSRPTDGEEHPEWRAHITFSPPLLRSATIRKFLVGYEMSAEPQRDLTPESAAARLRALPEAPYFVERS